MFNRNEKAYCMALLSLRNKDYQSALENFSSAAEAFSSNKEFVLLWKSTELLLEVKKKIRSAEDEEIEIEEVL